MAWDKAVPATSTPVKTGWPQLLTNQVAIEAALGAGHQFVTGGSQTGNHKEGSAICWYADSAPTTKQDGATALDADDNGTLWIDSDASPQAIYYYKHGTGWVALGTIMSLLDEDNMASDSATQAPSQQSVKAYADAITAAFQAADTALAAADQAYTDAAVAAIDAADDFSPSSYAGEESSTDPSGLITKMGYVSIGATSGTVSFGTEFPTALKSIQCTVSWNTTTLQSITVSSVTKAGFTWHFGDTGATGFYWEAKGY